MKFRVFIYIYIYISRNYQPCKETGKIGSKTRKKIKQIQSDIDVGLGWVVKHKWKTEKALFYWWNCNHRLGIAKENIEEFDKIIIYLQEYSWNGLRQWAEHRGSVGSITHWWYTTEHHSTVGTITHWGYTTEHHSSVGTITHWWYRTEHRGSVGTITHWW